MMSNGCSLSTIYMISTKDVSLMRLMRNEGALA